MNCSKRRLRRRRRRRIVTLTLTTALLVTPLAFDGTDLTNAGGNVAYAAENEAGESVSRSSTVEDPKAPANVKANQESVVAGSKEDDPEYYEQQEDALAFEAEAEELESYTSKVNPFTGDKYIYPDCVDGKTKSLGIDISKWNDTIDFAKVKAAGVKFVYIRVGFSGLATGAITEDPMWETNLKKAKAAGLKVGIYYFSQATTVTKARQEANYTINKIKDYDIDMQIVYDAEESTYTSGGKTYAGVLKKAALTKTQFTAVAEAFCDCVQAAGYQPMVYNSAGIMVPKGSAYRRLEYNTLKEKYGIWLARYGSSTNHLSSGGTTYALQKDTYLTLTHLDCWQVSGCGKVNGISGYTDIDVYFGELPTAGEHKHNFMEAGGTASTCKKKGIIRYECECGAHYNWFRPLDPNNHTFTNLVLKTAAVGDTPSVWSGTCSGCGATGTVKGGLVEIPILKLNAPSMCFQVGQKCTKLKATLDKNDGIKSWESSDTTIFKVAGKLNGTCSIRAQQKTGTAYLTLTTYSGLTKTIPITVQKGAVACTSLTNVPASITVKKGKTYQLKPIKHPMTCLTSITYTSASKAIATVTSAGKIKGVKKGTTTVKVVCGKKTYKVKVTVQ